MIDPKLLVATESRALGILVYGPPGTRKTWGGCTLPPPILMLDFEGGTTALTPWIRSRRKWNDTVATVYTQEQREAALASVHPKVLEPLYADGIMLKAGPFIDIVWFDTEEYASYEVMVQLIATFDKTKYNSLMVDSLQELCADVQTFSKGQAGKSKTLQETGSWGGAQERSKIILRNLRSLRDSGVFIYATCSEQIDKDYVTDPRNQGRIKEEPMSVKGTANVPGQLVSFTQHIFDIMLRARPMGAGPVWVAKSEPVGGGGAMWETKDRTGHLPPDYLKPSVRYLLELVYGQELKGQIYQWQKS